MDASKRKTEKTTLAASFNRRDLTKYDPFMSLLGHKSMSLFEAILGSVPHEQEKTALADMITLLEAYDKIDELLVPGLAKEVDGCAQVTTLFRCNSSVTKLMKGVTRLHSKPYFSFLRSRLTIILMGDTEMELDPSKATRKHIDPTPLIGACCSLFESISRHVECVPDRIRSLAYHIARAVEAKFPSDVLVQVGGFFFLRFLCPALIANPQDNGVLDPSLASPVNLRNLMLMSKVLQNLSNGVLFGDKEQYMTPLNQFLTQYSSKCTDFFLALSSSRVRVPRHLSQVEAVGVAMPELLRIITTHEVKEKLIKTFDSQVHQEEDISIILMNLEREKKDLILGSPMVAKPIIDAKKLDAKKKKVDVKKSTAKFHKLFIQQISVKDVQKAFNRVDVDGSGYLDRDEWTLLLVSLLAGIGIGCEEDKPGMDSFIDDLFEVCDSNKDGRISMEEFHNYMAKLAARNSIPDTLAAFFENADNEASLRMSFREIDKNGDGILDFEEVKAMFLNSNYFKVHYADIHPLADREKSIAISNRRAKQRLANSVEELFLDFLRWFWRQADERNTGYLTFDELKRALTQLRNGGYNREQDAGQ